MSECCGGVKLGQRIPDFDLTTYEPTKGEFGTFSAPDLGTPCRRRCRR
jgi:hypothetical protein